MSVRSLNKVMLIGNLTRDPELRYTPSGTAVCNFGIATNRQWTATDGTTQEATEFHRIVAWAKLAEICSQILFKGRKVYIEGRLQTREWAAADGSKQRTTEVVTDTMIVLDSRRREGMGAREGMPEMEAMPEVAPELLGEEIKAGEGGEAEAGTAGSPPMSNKSSKTDDKVNKKGKKKQEKGEKVIEGDEEVKPEDLPF